MKDGRVKKGHDPIILTFRKADSLTYSASEYFFHNLNAYLLRLLVISEVGLLCNVLYKD